MSINPPIVSQHETPHAVYKVVLKHEKLYAVVKTYELATCTDYNDALTVIKGDTHIDNCLAGDQDD